MAAPSLTAVARRPGHARPDLPAAPGRIGPNAITRVAEALRASLGDAATQALFDRAGLLAHLQCPPQTMVDEADVRSLHAVLREQLGAHAAANVARDAGRRTANYLLERRIPRPAQQVLKRLPAGWAARALLAAIGRNAWTFVGSGRYEARLGTPIVLTVQHNPMCAGWRAPGPVCDFYAATFERLFTVLVDPQARVSEVACEACGAPACRFEIHW